MIPRFTTRLKLFIYKIAQQAHPDRKVAQSSFIDKQLNTQTTPKMYLMLWIILGGLGAVLILLRPQQP